MYRLKTFLMTMVVFMQLSALGQSLSGPVDFFYAPDINAHKKVIGAIDSAQHSVKMVMYHLSDPAEITALENAAKRGINVRIIFDRGQWRSPKDSQSVTDLKNAGVNVVQATSAFRITHEKAMVVDDNLAMISTMNQVKAYMDMFDMGILTSDSGVIQEWLSVFETDWQNAANNGQVTPAVNNPNLLWSPVNSTDKLVALIGQAKNSIELTVENLADTNIQNALIDAAQRGVNVRTIVPKCDLTTPVSFNYPATSALRRANVDARMMPGPASPDTPYIHAKSIVVDQQVIYLGSENFSLSSLTLSREVGVILDNSNIVSGVHSLFEGLWTKAVLPPVDSNYKCSAFDVSTPGDPTKVATSVLDHLMIQPSIH